MKKSIVFIALGLLFFTGAMAQEISKNAIGIRLGDSDGFGAEANYQRAVGSNNNRLEFALGIRDNKNYSAFKLLGLYEWVFNIDGGFNWYVGPGAGIGQINVDDGRFNNGRFEDDDETFAFLAGVGGIEYSFDFPLLLSLDVRPELGFGDYRDDLDLDVGLSARYQF
ncbi:hypothetical protein ULMS_13200 [Patiriisocius marinistellae]|uniref:Outer membrane protein beta-barrel domain-containing protein n=1 Tax=Patiriisocius marinistellae TaxID=2494560 RepID=A0A5J4FXD7_9FLAO|nr:hypothetical protein [Patiriisocius marinistellae]GEQ85812.1 hypothetical protein ULMS_13200 [Patiriisocius marinistellae]